MSFEDSKERYVHSAGRKVTPISDRKRSGGLLRARRTAGRVSSMMRAP